ncbi:L,D-transpeptidase family protein [Candidatus Pelagibacter bacterium nBUS_29]|uniref:L,D-transpeptidase family protein n=1 Tax=Candidatus Pelagibacter bacterium nBUS_29 TaxID=3374190 RepID=UPI003EC14423
MTIFIKNKQTLQIDEFKFRCCIGKKGSTRNKKEGDKKTPKGTFGIENLYFRKDRKQKPSTILKCIKIQKSMGWCDDTRFPKKYNKLFMIEEKIKHEKLKRKDYKYDLLIPIKYNFKKPIVGKGSCIFIHLTKDYKPTAGCIALKEKDFLIMIKILKKKSKIKIF